MASDQVERKSETVERILDAAKDVFSEVGFAGARVDEIARRAGVNKAALYYHIGDKKALYAEVIHDIIGTAAERLMRMIKEAKTPEEKIKTYIRTLAATVDKNPQMPRIMMREIASGGTNLPEVFFHDLFSILGTLSGIIDKGKEDGEFIETIPMIVHFMIMGAIIIYKTIVPVIFSGPAIPKILKGINKNVSGSIAQEIETLILRAITTGGVQ
jgi:TetR/AcrR family transcriptional regulator